MSSELTPREQEVLSLIADGQSNKEIAQTLGIARGTVDLHVHHILQSLGVASRVMAVLWALGGRQAKDIYPTTKPSQVSDNW